MDQTYILSLEPGLRVAVRQRYDSWRGVIVAVDKTQVKVRMDDGSLRKFAPGSKLEIGSTGHKWMRPYICTVAEADDRDRAHRLATEAVAGRLAADQSPSWLVVKRMSF